jgi:hypothetical protein
MCNNRPVRKSCTGSCSSSPGLQEEIRRGSWQDQGGSHFRLRWWWRTRRWPRKKQFRGLRCRGWECDCTSVGWLFGTNLLCTKEFTWLGSISNGTHLDADALSATGPTTSVKYSIFSLWTTMGLPRNLTSALSAGKSRLFVYSEVY